MHAVAAQHSRCAVTHKTQRRPSVWIHRGDIDIQFHRVGVHPHEHRVFFVRLDGPDSKGYPVLVAGNQRPGDLEGMTRADQEAKFERLCGLVSEQLAEKGQRFTDRRRLILEKLYQSEAHLSVDELLLMVREVDPRVSYATVYRLMRALAEAGIVAEHHFGDGFGRYEVSEGVKHHDHLVCLDCGVVLEFEEPIIEELQDRVASSRGFELEAHRLELYVRCRKEHCDNRARAESDKPASGKVVPSVVPGLRASEALKR